MPPKKGNKNKGKKATPAADKAGDDDWDALLDAAPAVAEATPEPEAAAAEPAPEPEASPDAPDGADAAQAFLNAMGGACRCPGGQSRARLVLKGRSVARRGPSARAWTLSWGECGLGVRS